jgi:hypothetical protein
MRTSHPSPNAFPSIDAPRWIASALTVALLVACGDPSATPVTPQHAPQVDPSAAVVAAYGVAPVPSEFSWSQGQSAKLMGSAADRVCYLTYVAGDFNGGTEWVGISISLGKWWLSGGSSSSGVNAKARCIAVSSYSAEISEWTNGYASEKLSGYACGFTRIGGWFGSVTDRVWISDYPQRVLHVQTRPEPGSGVQASVRCITSPVQVTAPVEWFGSGTLKTLASTSSPWTCFLTGMGGDFDGSGDWVFAFKGTSVWYLWGAPDPERYAAGRCVK